MARDVTQQCDCQPASRRASALRRQSNGIGRDGLKGGAGCRDCPAEYHAGAPGNRGTESVRYFPTSQFKASPAHRVEIPLKTSWPTTCAEAFHPKGSNTRLVAWQRKMDDEPGGRAFRR